MEKTLMLHCPFINSQGFLLSRFPKIEIRFITALGAVFPWEEELFLQMLETFFVTENIQTIYFVPDLQSRFLHDWIQKGEAPTNKVVQSILEVFERHRMELPTESRASQRVSKMSLFLMEDQVARLHKHPPLQRLIQENNIQVKGILSDQSRSKSIEFQIQPAFQLS